ncbi:hypothetical protein G3M48_002651, partial [Beauveria asiatica]
PLMTFQKPVSRSSAVAAVRIHRYSLQPGTGFLGPNTQHRGQKRELHGVLANLPVRAARIRPNARVYLELADGRPVALDPNADLSCAYGCIVREADACAGVTSIDATGTPSINTNRAGCGVRRRKCIKIDDKKDEGEFEEDEEFLFTNKTTA